MTSTLRAGDHLERQRPIRRQRSFSSMLYSAVVNVCTSQLTSLCMAHCSRTLPHILLSLLSLLAASSTTPLLQPPSASAATAGHNFFFTHSCTHLHLISDKCMPTHAHANVCTHASQQDININDIYELSPNELDRALLCAVGMLWIVAHTPIQRVPAQLLMCLIIKIKSMYVNTHMQRCADMYAPH